jgi:ABC-2 type transport system ATP-binding protein
MSSPGMTSEAAGATDESAGATSELAVEAAGLEKSFGRVQVLAGVDLRVARGSVFALLGPNGAGKTTTVRILATLTRADAGRARVAGYDVDRDRRQVRRSISLAGQYAAVDALQTGAENLRMMARLAGLPGAQARRRADELLDQFGLADVGRRKAETYSGGMRRRLDLAASLVGTPSVIFLDEPTTGLDLPSRQVMWQTVRDLAGRGVTVFLTTQYLEEADMLAHQVAVIDGGRVVAEGTPARLKKLVAGQRLDLLLADAAGYDGVARRAGRRTVTADPDRLAIGVATDGTAAHVRALLDELDPERSAVRSFSVHTATLDDVFLAVTGHAATRLDQETAHV